MAGWLAALCLVNGSVVGAASGSEAAQEYMIEDWQIEDGLPQNSVSSLVQTQDGYLWLGTFNGLVRFDGMTVKVFDAVTTPELGSSRITQLHVDPAGKLWIVSEFGDVSCWQQGVFQAVRFAAGTLKGVVQVVTSDATGQIWLGDNQGGIYQLKANQLTLIPAQASFQSGRVISMTPDRRGNLWIAQRRGFARYGPAGYEVLRGLENPAEAPADYLKLSKDGEVWVTSKREGLCKYGPDKPPLNFERLPVGPVITRAVLEDRRRNIWLGTEGQGLLRYSPDGQWQVFSTTNGLSNNLLRCLWEDHEGNIWVGTDGGGLNRLKPKIFTSFENSSGLGEDAVFSVAQARHGNLWFGLKLHGLNELQNNKLRQVTPDTTISPILADREGAIWTGDEAGGFLRYQGSEVRRYPNPEDTRRTYSHALVQDRAGSIWLGHIAGMIQFSNGTFRGFSRRDGLPHEDVRAFAEDAEGTLYIGTNGGGLVKYQGGRFSVYGAQQGLGDNRVWSLMVDAEGTLWIGTFGSGLWRLKHGRFTSFKQALPAQVITCMVEDDLDFLWIGTIRGIFRVARRDLNAFAAGNISMLAYRSFDKSDGMATSECSAVGQPAVCKAADGRIWFATIKGVAVVDPRALPVNLEPPPVSIESVMLDGRAADAKGPGEGEGLGGPGLAVSGGSRTVDVPPGIKRVEFQYAGLSFAAPEKVRFRYRLEGVDEDWVEAGNRRIAYYGEIRPGDYRFRVLACNQDGVWNTRGAMLALVVHPYFWQTGWFLGLAVLGLVAMGGVTARLISVRRFNRKLAVVKQQHAVERERARIAQDIHDDLGSRLTQIGMLSELARRPSTKPEEMRAHLGRIGGNTREMIQAMDEIVWAVDPSKDTLENLINYFVTFTEEFLDGSGIRCRWDLPDILPHHPLSAEARHNIFLIVKEALNNIIKHSGASEVWFRVTWQEPRLELVLKDNGRGFVPSSSSGSGEAGNGLENMKKRAADLGGSFQLRTEREKGTEIQLTFDLKGQGE